VLTQTYHFPQANLSMEGLGVGLFDIFCPCQPLQDNQVEYFLLLLWYLAEYELQRAGRRRMEVEDSCTLLHFQARPLPRFSLLSNIDHEKMCPSGSPQEGCELLHPGCLKIKVALLSSKFSVPSSPGSCIRCLFYWQTCCYFTCCFYGSF